MDRLAWVRVNPSRASRGHGDPTINSLLGEGLVKRLRTETSPACRLQVEALLYENDPALLAAGLLDVAQILNNSRQVELAVALLQYLEQKAPPALARQAQLNLNLLLGRGGFPEKFEFTLRHLVEQSLDPTLIISMGLAGASYRLVRLASLRHFGSGFLARIGASIAGLAAEVPVFTFSTRAGAQVLGRVPESGFGPLSEELAASTLLLGSLKLTGGLGGLLLRGAASQGAMARLNQAAIPAASLFVGIALGHRLQEKAGLKSPTENPFADDLLAFFQFQIAGHLSRGLLGKDFASWERTLDLRAEQRLSHAARLDGLSFATLGPSRLPLLEPKEIPRGPLLSRMLGMEEAPSPEHKTVLQNQYLRIFPADRHGYYSHAILESVCKIRCGIPEFHERLLDALNRDPRRGTLNQLFGVLAIEDAFNTDGMRTATGSFDYAALRLLIGRVIAENDAGRRNHDMQRIFAGLEMGLTRSNLQNLLLQFSVEPGLSAHPEILYTETFWSHHSKAAMAAWEGYREKDILLLFNFAYLHSRGNEVQAAEIIRTFGEGRRDGRYSVAELDAVLDLAARHPLGDLVLQRLHSIFAVRDVPAKITDMATESSPIATSDLIYNFGQMGLGPDAIALRINGTEHTAYLNDLRLARKVVSVFQEIQEHLANPELTEAGRKQWVQSFKSFTRSGIPLHPSHLVGWLGLQKDPISLQHAEMLTHGGVDIQLVTPESFQGFLKDWGKTHGTQLAVTELRRHRGERDRILIPQLPPFNLATTEGMDRAFSELIGRVQSLAHEAEHWRHGNGYFMGIESASHPVLLTGISRQERLVSEVMAYLEEFRWRIKNCDRDYLEISWRLGETLPSYLRNLADRQYYLKANEAKVLP